MKNLPLNISSMVKIAGDKQSSTFQHKDGHQIIVAHNPLPAIQRKQLEKLPIKMAEGGGLGSLAASLKQAFKTPTPAPTPVKNDRDEEYDKIRQQNTANMNQNSYASGTDSVQPSDQELDKPPQIPDQSSQHTININVGQPQTPANLYGNQPVANNLPNLPNANSGANLVNPNSTANVPQAVKQELALAPEQQKLDVAAGQNRATEESAYTKQRAAQAQQDQEHINDMKQHTEEFAKWNQDPNNQVNPNHWADTRALGKTGAAMSLFLSGFAGGLGNAGPMNFINSQIDRDIDAQKSRIGQQKSVFEAYNKLYDNQNIASNLTKVSMNDLYSHRMNQIADKIGTQQAKINAQMFQGQKILENRQLLLDSSQDPGMDSAYRRSQEVQGKVPTEQAPSVPFIDENGKAQGVPTQGQNQPPQPSKEGAPQEPIYPTYHLLSPNAEKILQNKLPLDPRIKKNPAVLDTINNQYTAAQQAEKVLNGPKNDGVGGIHDLIQQMYTNTGSGNSFTGLPGHIRRTTEGSLSSIPIVGPAAEAIAGVVPKSQAQKQFASGKSTLETDLATALNGLIAPTDINKIVEANLPAYQDKPEDISRKEKAIVNMVIKAVKTSQLKTYHMTNE